MTTAPRRLWTRLLAAPALVGLALASPAQTTWYVDVNGTAPGSGTLGDPFTNIQAAIDVASGVGIGDLIEVAPGTYVEDLALNGKSLRIYSAQGPEVTIVQSDGTGSAAAVHMNDSTLATLEGLTLTGVTDNRPSVFITFGSIPTFRRCVIRDNTGGGITGVYDANISECTITRNEWGISTPGGLFFWNVSNSIVWGNTRPSTWSTIAGCVRYSIMDTSPFPCAQGNQFVDPQLWDPGAADLYPKPGSPAIDQGDPAAPLDPDGTRIDIGAFTYANDHAPVAPQPYCTSRTNSQGCSPALSTVGAPSAGGSPFTIHCTNVINNKTGLFFYGFLGKATPYQGGWLCVQAPVRRTPLQNSGGNPPPDDCSGAYVFDFDMLIGDGTDPLLFAGQAVFGQYWYRDPAQGGPWTTGRSEGIGFLVGP